MFRRAESERFCFFCKKYFNWEFIKFWGEMSIKIYQKQLKNTDKNELKATINFPLKIHQYGFIVFKSSKQICHIARHIFCHMSFPVIIAFTNRCIYHVRNIPRRKHYFYISLNKSILVYFQREAYEQLKASEKVYQQKGKRIIKVFLLYEFTNNTQIMMSSLPEIFEKVC